MPNYDEYYDESPGEEKLESQLFTPSFTFANITMATSYESSQDSEFATASSSLAGSFNLNTSSAAHSNSLSSSPLSPRSVPHSTTQSAEADRKPRQSPKSLDPPQLSTINSTVHTSLPTRASAAAPEPICIHSDSDDDFVVIDSSRASDEARSRWASDAVIQAASSKFKKEPGIKEEPIDLDSDVEVTRDAAAWGKAARVKKEPAIKQEPIELDSDMEVTNDAMAWGKASKVKKESVVKQQVKQEPIDLDSDSEITRNATVLQHKAKGGLNNGVPAAKKPAPNDPAPGTEVTGEQLTLQKRMKQKFAAKRKAAEASAAPSRKSVKFARQVESSLASRVQQHGEDDGFADDDEDLEQRELDELMAKKAILETKGDSSEAHGLEMAMLQGRIERLHNRRELANRPDAPIQDEEVLMRDAESGNTETAPETRSGASQQCKDQGNASQSSSSQKASRQGNAANEKKKRRIPKNPQEFRERERERKLEREKERERKRKERSKSKPGPKKAAPSRQNASGKGKGKEKKGNNGGKKGSKGKGAYKNRMSAGRWGESDDTLRDLVQTFMQSDMIADQALHAGISAAPEIKATTKMDQLQALFKNIPEDYDTHKAKLEQKDLDRAAKSFGNRKMMAVNGRWLLKGMISDLYHHQMMAARWMLDRELATEAPYGGLLADSMGLGKTIETLTTMVANPAEGKFLERGIKATLIVVPSSVVNQWIQEVATHVKPDIFKKPRRFKKSFELPADTYAETDIVVTSYQEVMKSYPNPDPAKIAEISKNPDGPTVEDYIKKITGVLHKIHWYRVILDEAHIIKNHKSRTSMACSALKAEYRWALSGTPIQNGLYELYPYFKFLQTGYTSSYDDFKKHYADPDAEDANNRLTVTLSVIMLRRTGKDRLLGRPLISLPQCHGSTTFLEFTREEAFLYRTLEDRFRDIINRHFQAGNAQKNYGVFLAQLGRLRQATAHPFLLEQCFKDIFTSEDLISIKDRLIELGDSAKPLYEQIEQWVTEPDKEKLPFGLNAFGTAFDMSKFLGNVDGEEAMNRMVCKLCGDLPYQPQITECSHIFCGECLTNEMHRQAAGSEGNLTKCPTCQNTFEKMKPYKGKDWNGDGDIVIESTDEEERKRRKRRRKEDEDEPYHLHISGSKWLKIVMNNMAELVPSAKMIALKAKILTWLREAPDDKILIFTQFRMVAKIIGLICDQEGWGYCFFLGDMSQTQKQRSITEFHNSPRCKIMIAGLKCGGQGLNLTCASRCISVDLWWNNSVEQQAFHRIFRIGQKKETHFTRLVVRNTVDVRLLDMQRDKMRAIDKVMQDTGSIIEPLSVNELASLFGHLKRSDDGTMKVVADYQDGDGASQEMGTEPGEGDGDESGGDEE